MSKDEINAYASRAFGANPRLANAFKALCAKMSFEKKTTGASLRRTLQVSEAGSPIELFDYQEEIANQVTATIGFRQNRAMVSLPTGAGKTATAAAICLRLYQSRAVQRILWVAPGIELIEQAATAFQIQGIRPNLDAVLHLHMLPARADNGRLSVVFRTVQSLVRDIDGHRAYRPDLVVFDEAHQAAAPRYSFAVRQLCEHGNCSLIGLSATPGRRTTQEQDQLSLLFDGNLLTPEVLGPNPVRTLGERGIYASLDWRKVRFSAPHEYLSLDLTKPGPAITDVCSQSIRFWRTIDEITRCQTRDKVLVFCSSVVHCHAVRAALAFQEVRSQSVDYHTPPRQREAAINSFREGSLQVLLNVSILNTGFDFPALSQVVLAGPIRSPILWEQTVGRVARGPSVGGSARALVVDFDKHDQLHSAIRSVARYAGEGWS